MYKVKIFLFSFINNPVRRECMWGNQEAIDAAVNKQLKRRSEIKPKTPMIF
jgi:hypothetical protein